MAYKVFISHSTRDRGIVVSLANLLSKFGVAVQVADWYLMPTQNIQPRVFEQINQADCVVALLTRNGIRANWVQQELGYALERKPVLPLIEKGVDESSLAYLGGRDYIEYDPNHPENALLTASDYVKSLKLNKEEREKALLVAGGIVAFLLLLSGEER
jgi:nucleoside 2-deoxyribosyltransferase